MSSSMLPRSVLSHFFGTWAVGHLPALVSVFSRSEQWENNYFNNNYYCDIFLIKGVNEFWIFEYSFADPNIRIFISIFKYPELYVFHPKMSDKLNDFSQFFFRETYQMYRCVTCAFNNTPYMTIPFLEDSALTLSWCNFFINQDIIKLQKVNVALA